MSLAPLDDDGMHHVDLVDIFELRRRNFRYPVRMYMPRGYEAPEVLKARVHRPRMRVADEVDEAPQRAPWGTQLPPPRLDPDPFWLRLRLRCLVSLLVWGRWYLRDARKGSEEEQLQRQRRAARLRARRTRERRVRLAALREEERAARDRKWERQRQQEQRAAEARATTTRKKKPLRRYLRYPPLRAYALGRDAAGVLVIEAQCLCGTISNIRPPIPSSGQCPACGAVSSIELDRIEAAVNAFFRA